MYDLKIITEVIDYRESTLEVTLREYIAHKVKTRRNELGLSVIELSRKTMSKNGSAPEVSNSFISSVEAGESKIVLSKLEALAKGLGLDVLQLFPDNSKFHNN